MRLQGVFMLWLWTLAGVDTQYEWSCSALDTTNNHYTLPDLGTLLEDDGNVQAVRFDLQGSSFNNLYIYPLPSTLNCNGTVSSMRYCYYVFQLGTEQLIFTLLTLEQNELNFMIRNVISVRSTPTSQICTAAVFFRFTSQYCCDVFVLNVVDHFPLPATDFAFGIATASVFVLRFDGRDYPQYQVEQYSQGTGQLGSLTEGNTISVDSGSITTSETLRLFQFFITPIPVTEQPTTEMTTSVSTATDSITPALTSNPTAATTASTPLPTSIPTIATTASTPLPTSIPATATTAATTASTPPQTSPTPLSTTETSTTGGSTTTEIDEMAETGEVDTSTMDDGTTTKGGGNSGTDFTSDGPDSVGGGGGGGGVGGIVGGVVGVIVVVALLLVMIILVILVLRKRTSWKPEQATQGNTFSNALYESDVRYETVKGGYAGIGPHTYSDIGEVAGNAAAHSYELISQGPSHEYSYGRVGAGLKDDNTYEVLTEISSVKKQSKETTSPEIERIYQVPGRDELTLYAQLNEIVTDNVTRESVILGDLLGSGQFGTVYKGVWLSATRGEVDVAVKTLKEGSGEEDRVKFLQEAAIMGQFKHPNVVEMYGVVTQGEPILLVLEILKNGDLRDHFLHMRSDEEGGVSVDDHTLLNYCRQVASGMAYLSSKAFVHRDLAARNILVSNDNICKIADFGMSRDLMNESYYVSHGGKIPVKWTAPEALHYKKYSTASDVWSYGALMYEIWSVGHKPFENLSNFSVIKLVDTGVRLAPPPGCPRALYAIMVSCWHPKTSERPGFAAISHQLSPIDSELLKWTEEDKSTHPEADKLGANLLYAQDLYKDLQMLYKQDIT